MRVVPVFIALVLGAGLVACKRTGPPAQPPTEPAHAPGTAAQGPPGQPQPTRNQPSAHQITSWVYQLQNYDHDRLDGLARPPFQLAAIYLAPAGGCDWVRPE